jgi:hypothetical protein
MLQAASRKAAGSKHDQMSVILSTCLILPVTNRVAEKETEMSLGSRERPVREANNLNAIGEPIV